MHITICYCCVFWKVFCCPWTFSEGILCQTFVGYKSKFLTKMNLNFNLWNFNISETYGIKNNTVSIRYVSINFYRKFDRKKNLNSLFLKDQTQRTRNMLKALHGCINGGFQLSVILPFMIADNLKGGLLLWITTVVLTKVCSFS